MITIKCLIDKKYPIDHVLTDEDRKALIEENKDANYSYLCLLKEMLHYRDMTVESILHGWSGIKLVKID